MYNYIYTPSNKVIEIQFFSKIKIEFMTDRLCLCGF